MDTDTLVASLQAAVPEAQIERVASLDLQTTFYVSREAVPAVARALRERPDLGFTFLSELTAVDFWPKEPPAPEGSPAIRRSPPRDGQ
jgi:NADH:ubiquinone oxidoreductase subunit C